MPAGSIQNDLSLASPGFFASLFVALCARHSEVQID